MEADARQVGDGQLFLRRASRLATGDDLSKLGMHGGALRVTDGLIAQGRGKEGIEEQGILSYLEIQTDRQHGRRIQARLTKLLKSLEVRHPGEKPGEKSYRLTIAFYPIEPDS